MWKLAAGLVEALQAVHSCGLVHRDLKPANVLLALDGPRVIDFGISRALEKTAMTSTGMIVGTPSYMSPEQAEGGRVGPPSDVFSLGCVIVFAATGMGPFGNGPQASMLYRVVHAEPALDEMPGGLRELAAACLAKAPADRPGLAELVDATAAGRAPDDGDALASFWPAAVTGLIRSHQATSPVEKPDRAGTSPGTAETAPAAYSEPEVTRLNTAAGAEAAPAACLPDQTMAGQPGDARRRRDQHARGLDRRAGPWRDPPACSGGLAVMAGSGLASAGWELSQGASGQHLARPGHGSPAVTPRSAGGPAQHRHAAQHGHAAGAGELWSFPAGGMVAGLALDRGTVFAGSTDGRVYALRAADGSQLWAFPTGGPVQSGIAAARGPGLRRQR